MIKGSVGPPGDNGTRGDVGPEGQPGQQGEKGNRGVRGRQGEMGDEGKKLQLQQLRRVDETHIFCPQVRKVLMGYLGGEGQGETEERREIPQWMEMRERKVC